MQKGQRLLPTLKVAAAEQHTLIKLVGLSLGFAVYGAGL